MNGGFILKCIWLLVGYFHHFLEKQPKFYTSTYIEINESVISINIPMEEMFCFVSQDPPLPQVFIISIPLSISGFLLVPLLLLHSKLLWIPPVSGSNPPCWLQALCSWAVLRKSSDGTRDGGSFNSPRAPAVSSDNSAITAKIKCGTTGGGLTDALMDSELFACHIQPLNN